jgi:hypothetical protein
MQNMERTRKVLTGVRTSMLYGSLAPWKKYNRECDQLMMVLDLMTMMSHRSVVRRLRAKDEGR